MSEADGTSVDALDRSATARADTDPIRVARAVDGGPELASVGRGRGVRDIEGRLPGSGLAFRMRPHACFACGTLNAHGLQLSLHFEPGRCWTELVLPERFMGWEGIAHGGILCTILDEVMAWSLIEQDSWGVTARLDVSFRQPVPVGIRIRAEGEIVERRRRLYRTAARILTGVGDEQRELASATGLYVAADEARQRELKERYEFRILGAGVLPEGCASGNETTLPGDEAHARAEAAPRPTLGPTPR